MLNQEQHGEIVVAKAAPERPLDALLRLASTARLHRSADGRLHARVKVGDRFNTYGLKASAGLQDWLTDAYFATCGQPPSEWAVRRVIGLLKARARFDGGTPSVSIRVGQFDGADPFYFVDLGDPSGRAVRIGPEGWDLVEKPGIHFWRPDGLMPLPTPQSGGSLDLLRPYVNVSDDDFRLLIAWLTAACRPVGPYPVLVLYGEQGSAKSTLTRILRLLIDPQNCPLLGEPKTTRDLMVTAVNGWLLAYDNVSSLSNDLSNSLCRLAFGGGISDRKLFSNDERFVIAAQRPLIFNGIEEFVVRGDLIDRSIIIHLPTILPASRRSEHTFWNAFRADYPRILGGVYDAIAGGLRELPSVSLPELPRMADYAQWGEAVGRGLGWDPGAFLWTYSGNCRDATVPLLGGSAVASVLFQTARTLDQKEWQGCSPSQAYAQLTRHMRWSAADSVRHLLPHEARRIMAASTARWPKDVQEFSKELRRIAPQCRLHGLSIDFKRTNEGRQIFFNYEELPGQESEEERQLRAAFEYARKSKGHS